jgi:flagellar protein FlaJ
MNLRSYIRDQIRKDPVRYHSLHADMISSRLGMTVEQFIWRSLVISLLCGILLSVFGFLFGNMIVYALGSSSSGIYNVFYLQIPAFIFSPAFARYIQVLSVVVCFAVGTYVAYATLLRFPGIEKRNRAIRINLTLHNAVAYMYAMRRGGAQLMMIFHSLSDHSDIYGEVALEFRQIVRDADFFGYDLISAVRHLIETTPSEKLKNFLEDLLSVIESGGDMSEFLSMRVRLYQEEARFEQKQFLNFLAIVAESYVTLFVAGPLFLIIIMVIMGMIGSGAVVQLSLVTYAFIPIGSVIFILLLDLISVKGEKTERYVKVKVLEEYPEVRLIQRGDEDSLFAQLKRYDKTRNLTSIIRHPFEGFVKNVTNAFYITVPIATIYILTMLLSIPHYADIEIFIDVVDDHIVMALLIILLPFAVFYEVWARKIAGIESLIPDFLERMAGINQVGLTIAQAVAIMVNTNLGLLSYEIRRIKRDMDWGANFTDALMRFEDRIRSPSIARTVSLITKASEMSGSIGEVLSIASSDAKMTEVLKRERSAEMFIYTAIVYLSFLVFIFVVAVLTTQFLPVLASVSVGALANAGPLSGIGSVPIKTFSRLLYHTCIMQAIFSGLIAGQMGEGSLNAGVKHACVLLLIAIVTFNFVI